MPPLVKVISFGAAPNIPAIKSLDSSNKFLALLDNSWPPDELANATSSASLNASKAISRMGVVAA